MATRAPNKLAIEIIASDAMGESPYLCLCSNGGRGLAHYNYSIST